MNSMLESFNDPQSRHAILVHFPLALCILGALPLLGLAATKFKSRSLQAVCLAWFLAASLGAFLAANAGEAAEDAAEHGGGPPLAAGAERAIHDHEELAELGWLWPLIPGACVGGVMLIRRPGLRAGAGVLAIVGALGVAGWAAYTGHTGGRLVYEFGVGAPSAANAGGAPVAPADGGAAAPAEAERDDD